MLALRRNPLLQLLARFCWLPVLGTFLLAWGLLGDESLGAAAWGLGGLLAMVATMVATACIHGEVAALRVRASRRLRGHRFLCPDCLEFGDLHWACKGCGAEVEPFVIHTEGLYVDNCPRCGLALFPEEPGGPVQVRALCILCGSASDASRHWRRVRVLGTLCGEDLDSLREAPGAREGRAGGIRYVEQDDGRCLTCVLCLGDPGRTSRPYRRNHAALTLEAIWIGGGDPLALGRSADQYLRRAGLSPGQRRRVPVYIGVPEPDPAVRHALKARFGEIHAGVPAYEVNGSMSK